MEEGPAKAAPEGRPAKISGRLVPIASALAQRVPALGAAVASILGKREFGRVRKLERKHQATTAKLERKHQATTAKLERKHQATTAKLQRAVKEMKIQARVRDLQLARVPRYEYGSYTPGVVGWGDRWREAEGKRLLMYAPKDYSGSFVKWAEALNRHSSYAARVIAFQVSQYGHGIDLLMPQPGLVESEFYRLVDEADIIHIKEERFFSEEMASPSAYHPYFDDVRPALLESGKPIVFTHYGGWARSLKDNEHYQRAVLGCAARITMTPDLAHPWFDGYYIPHLVDTEAIPYDWQDTRKVAHSPSTRARKGTDMFLKAATALPDVEVEVIEGVSHAECMQRKRTAGLFFDQAGAEESPRLGVTDVIGWYGNAAIEAAAYGIPTIAHLSPKSFEGARRCSKDIEESCPILNTPRNTEGMRRLMTEFFELSAPERRALSERTRAFMEDFHSYHAAAPQLEAVYESVRGRQVRPSNNSIASRPGLAATAGTAAAHAEVGLRRR